MIIKYVSEHVPEWCVLFCYKFLRAFTAWIPYKFKSRSRRSGNNLQEGQTAQADHMFPEGQTSAPDHLFKEGRGGYIEDQKLLGMLPYGNSTASYAGCGAVAVYNALVGMGVETKITDVTYWLERHSLVSGGKLGSLPSRVVGFFENRQFVDANSMEAVRIDCRKVPLKKVENSCIAGNDAVIVAVQNNIHDLRDGIHILAITKTGVGMNADSGIEAASGIDNGSVSKSTVWEAHNTGGGKLVGESPEDVLGRLNNGKSRTLFFCVLCKSCVYTNP